jgi:hypothetical protein
MKKQSQIPKEVCGSHRAPHKDGGALLFVAFAVGLLLFIQWYLS